MTNNSDTCLRERLPASARAPGAARHSIDRTLSDLPSPLVDRVKLLVSELVTNAVLHGPKASGSAVDLTVRLTRGSVSVEVADTGAGFEQRLLAPSVRDSGWGLFLVDRLSDRWGVIRNDQTKVWFEIDRIAS